MRAALGIFGAGGHAKVVADTVARGAVYRVHAYYDDNAERHGTLFYGERPIAGGLDDLLADLRAGRLAAAFVAIGHNVARERIGEAILRSGHTLATLIDPTAVVSPSVELGAGTLIVAGAILNADTVVGCHVIVNTGASIDHDCRIQDAVHIAPHATLCGGVNVGARTLVGAAATMIPGTSLPPDSTLGAGSTLCAAQSATGVYVGSPAFYRPIV